MKFIILGIYIFGYITGSFSLKIFELENYCKENGSYDLSMIGEDIYGGELQFSFKTYMPGDFTCTVIIGSHGFDTGDRMAFYFTRFDLGDNCGVGETWLSVVDGDLTTEPDPIIGLQTRLCGRSFSYHSQTFETSWRYLQVEYHANNPPVGSGFAIVFKHFSDPPCASYEYRCDNDRCIRDKLKCNGDNPCGDNSDCKKGLSMGAIVGIIAGCCAGLGILTFLYQMLPKCFKSQSRHDSNQQQRVRNPVTPEFSRAPYSTSQYERQDSTNVDAANPPSYASLQDTSNDISDIRHRVNDATHHGTDVMHQHNSAASHHSVSPSAPIDTESNTEENDNEYRPPPPSYDEAVSYKDVYKVSETEPHYV